MLLACRSEHGGKAYERLLYGSVLILQLHHWDAHEHPNIGDPDAKPYGNGVLLWFQMNVFDQAVSWAHKLGAEILKATHVNPSAHHRECWL
jgi:hypothetical protein